MKAHVETLLDTALSPASPARDVGAAVASLRSVHSPTFALHYAHLAAIASSQAGANTGSESSDAAVADAPTAGYGRISGYGAGSRLVSSAAAWARPDSPATVTGLCVGAAVTCAYGPGKLVGVSAAGTVAEVAFSRGSVGACCFPYGSALLRATAIRRLPPGAPEHRELDSGLLAFVTAAPGEDLQAFLPPELCVDVVGCLLRQLAEKLDLLRGAAGALVVLNMSFMCF